MRVTYDSDNGKWYKATEDYRLQEVAEGKLRRQFAPGIGALTYHDAFLELFGTEAPIPQIERSVRHPVVG